jgi:penicillin-binding protein 2B
LKRKNITFGATGFLLIFVLLFFILFGRFFYIQKNGKVDGQTLDKLAENIYSKEVKLEAHRGTIFDQNGIPLAEDIVSYNLVAILDPKQTTIPDKPMHVIDPDLTAEKLAPILGIEKSEIKNKLSRKNLFQVEFGTKGKGLSHDKKNMIEKLKLPGITFYRTTKRYYPNGTFAAHSLGFSRVDDNGNSYGVMGLEKSLDKYLKETDGKISFKKDYFGFRLPNADEEVVNPKNGDDVYLTIDQKIQTFVEDAVSRVDKQYKPKEIIVIVANPKNGEILAITSRPSFNPNKRDIENYMNTPIEYPFEPGSTMKIFTLASAIEEGVYKGNAKYKSGCYKVNINTICDHNGYGWGTITYNEGVQRSSNVAFANIAEHQLGFDRLFQYLNKFGFSKPTGIDLPNEQSGKLLYKYKIEKTTTAFGQGTSVTPIQQLQAATSIANNGKMMNLHIIKKVEDKVSKEVLYSAEPKVVGQPISSNTATTVRNILETVVTSPNGTGKKYKIEGYSVAGKTGTAQIPGPDGKYLTGYENYIFSFMGMAPKDDPKLIMYVAVKQPDLGEFELGSEPVSAIFRPVIKNSLQYLNIKPNNNTTKTIVNKDIKLENYISLEKSKVIDKLTQKKLKPIVLGNGNKITGQMPGKGEQVVVGDKIILLTEGVIKMPDFKNWSLRDVLKVKQLLSLQLHVKGNGYVSTQSINPGKSIKHGDYLNITLTEPNSVVKKREDEALSEVEVNDGTITPLD